MNDTAFSGIVVGYSVIFVFDEFAASVSGGGNGGFTVAPADYLDTEMEDWAKRLDIFLAADEREVLQNVGKITAKIAKEHAESEFEKYRVIQDRLFQSDFDRAVLAMEDAAEEGGEV